MERKYKFNPKKGDKFNRWTFIEEVDPRIILTPKGEQKIQRKALCKCDCGTIREIQLLPMVNGKIKSCGCLNKKYSKEQTSSFLYSTWSGIKQRTTDKNCSHYHLYGGRGISMCDEWHNDYIAFYNWSIANGASKKLTIDRIDNNGNYEPSNCRWTDIKTQARNTRQNRIIEYNGVSQTLAEWAEELNIGESTIRFRLDKYGFSVAEALGFESHIQKERPVRLETRKATLQYDVDGNFIKEWETSSIAANELNISRGSIDACARGIQKTGGGFVWVKPKMKTAKSQKAIYQYNTEGELINSFVNVVEASKVLNVSCYKISTICRGAYRFATDLHLSYIKN